MVAGFGGIRRKGQPLAWIERAIVAIADSQRGLITLEQLLEIGLSYSAVERRVALGRLTRIHRGVYTVGTANPDTKARWLAATLAAGPGSLLGYLSGAGLWKLWPEHPGRPHVVMEGAGRLGHPGILMHRMRQMHEDDFAVHDGIPVTSLELTCLHLASQLTCRSFERATIKAARRREFSLDRAVELIDRSLGRPGVKRFRSVVGRDLAAELHSLSELELRFVELLRSAKVVMPEINHDVESMMVDAVWHDAKVVVELDGFEFHKLPRDLRNDNARTRRLVLAGYRVIRFVWRDLVESSGDVTAALVGLLAPTSP